MVSRLQDSRTGLLFEEEQPSPVERIGKIHVGTSGYSFADWQGPFYPTGLRREQWLRFYAQHFTAVEINATYYRTPPPSTFELMADRTPDRFEFWVKVPGQTTHKDNDFVPAIDQFMEAVEPLGDAGKLRGFLAQFPPSFRRSEKALDRLDRFREAVKEITLAVEFRHEDWLVDETFEFLQERGIVYVSVDLPSLSGLPGSEARVTGPVSYVRFHGRNRRTWYNPGLGDRYDYEYSETELAEWIPRILKLDEESSATYLFFNNCHAGQAVKNARMLRQMLELEIEGEA